MNQKKKMCKQDGANKINERYFRSLIGCLMYLTATHPDILNVVSIFSNFMHCARIASQSCQGNDWICQRYKLFWC